MKKRMTKTLEKELLQSAREMEQVLSQRDFSSLEKSLKQAVLISQGKLAPARVTTLERHKPK